MKEIENDSAADNIGITVTLEAEGPVINPAVYHAESGEFIKIGNEVRSFSINAGDVVIITTETNNKAVYLVRDGVKQEINEYLDEDSDFIQLQHGTNTIRYTADAGEDYLNVTVSYRFRYLGAVIWKVRIYDRDLNFKGVIEKPHFSDLDTEILRTGKFSRSTPRSQNKTFTYWQKETLFPNVAAAKRE